MSTLEEEAVNMQKQFAEDILVKTQLVTKIVIKFQEATMEKKGKLELTWVGKYEEEKLEPRILIEDKSKSYGDSNTENMLIHGDNLLALKALENKYTGMIKCIYIDPPYNTGVAFEHYDDNLEHSIWLGIMKKRLEILRNLLAEDGTIWIVSAQFLGNQIFAGS